MSKQNYSYLTEDDKFNIKNSFATNGQKFNPVNYNK